MAGLNKKTPVTLCYKDAATGLQQYVDLCYGDVEQWKTAHPGCVATKLFLASSDRISGDAELESAFLSRCVGYGMSPDDLHRKYLDGNGHTVELIGMRPENTKYKFIFMDLTTMTRVKASREYVRSVSPLAASDGNG